MSEIYWITRLDDLNGLLNTFIAISAVLSMAFTILYVVGKGGEWKETPSFKRILKISIPTLIISILLHTFTPTKEDMFLIYGVGGTIDYIKENDKAKQLPDKCINALDAWVNNLNVEQSKSN